MKFAVQSVYFVTVAMFVGCLTTTPSTPKSSDDPFDPEASLYPEYPITEVLSVKLEPVKEPFIFGEYPQFRITFRNLSESVIDLTGVPVDGTKFRPYRSLKILREDGRNLGSGTDLKLDPNNSRIPPGETLMIDFPSSKAVAAINEFYRKDPSVLLPGNYRCYYFSWVEKDGEPERLISPLTSLVIVDDDSGDVRISEAVQTARGVREHLELVIREEENSQIRLTALNHGPEPIYLGHNRSWWSRFEGSDHWWPGRGGGVRPYGYITVPPNGTHSFGGMRFHSSRPPGIYMIQARYYDFENRLQKESNIISITIE